MILFLWHARRIVLIWKTHWTHDVLWDKWYRRARSDRWSKHWNRFWILSRRNTGVFESQCRRMFSSISWISRWSCLSMNWYGFLGMCRWQYVRINDEFIHRWFSTQERTIIDCSIWTDTVSIICVGPILECCDRCCIAPNSGVCILIMMIRRPSPAIATVWTPTSHLTNVECLFKTSWVDAFYILSFRLRILSYITELEHTVKIFYSLVVTIRSGQLIKITVRLFLFFCRTTVRSTMKSISSFLSTLIHIHMFYHLEGSCKLNEFLRIVFNTSQ